MELKEKRVRDDDILGMYGISSSVLELFLVGYGMVIIESCPAQRFNWDRIHLYVTRDSSNLHLSFPFQKFSHKVRWCNRPWFLYISEILHHMRVLFPKVHRFLSC